MRRIVVFGPESTGKTQLARELATRLESPWSQEYVRLFWDEHQGRITAADLDAIGRGQVAIEDAAASRGLGYVIHDTDLLTCTLWNDLLFPGACPQWVREEAEVRARRTSLFLLCATDLPFEPDPQRCFPDGEGRRMCMDLWRSTLVRRGLPFVEISGAGIGRLETALASVEAIGRLSG